MLKGLFTGSLSIAKKCILFCDLIESFYNTWEFKKNRKIKGGVEIAVVGKLFDVSLQMCSGV